MNLKPIPNYEGYSFDLNNNQVYSHYKKKYRKLNVNVRGYYYIQLWKNSKIKTLQLHRLIYEMYNGTIPEKMFIDHIDCNILNNNITNLRLANKSQNSCNIKTKKNNLSTGHKNIYQRHKYNTYEVKIYKNGKRVYYKTFKTLEEAIINRDIKLKEIHGEFANLG